MVLPRRWVAERTLSWPDALSALCRDYEPLTATSEAMIQWAGALTPGLSRDGAGPAPTRP